MHRGVQLAPGRGLARRVQASRCRLPCCTASTIALPRSSEVDHATTAAKLQARQQKGLAAKASEMAKLLCCTTPTVLKLFEASPDLRQTSSAALVQRLMAIKEACPACNPAKMLKKEPALFLEVELSSMMEQLPRNFSRLQSLLHSSRSESAVDRCHRMPSSLFDKQTVAAIRRAEEGRQTLQARPLVTSLRELNRDRIRTMNEKQLRMRINKIQKRAKMESFIEELQEAGMDDLCREAELRLQQL